MEQLQLLVIVQIFHSVCETVKLLHLGSFQRPKLKKESLQQLKRQQAEFQKDLVLLVPSMRLQPKQQQL